MLRLGASGATSKSNSQIRRDESLQRVVEEPSIGIIHRVECNNSQMGHFDHPRSATFLDPPRLWKGDCKASALRGEKILEDIEKYKTTHNYLNLVVRTYSCTNFHRVNDEIFEKKDPPFLNPNVPKALHPYFSIVLETTKPAIESQEVIHLSQHFREAMESLEKQDKALFQGWEQNMTPPYLNIYHTRHRMRSMASDLTNSTHSSHLHGILDHIEEKYEKEFLEAEALFSEGRVDKHHFHKLFAPNDVLVSYIAGEPIGFISPTCPQPHALPIRLKCFTFEYDGTFHKKEKTFDVFWPSDISDAIEITSLNIFPLRLSPSKGLEDALRSRGNTFWTCRGRNFVAYNAPNPTLEMRVSKPRYMIDMATFKVLHAPKDIKDNPRVNKTDDNMVEGERPSLGTFVLLLPSEITGYGMHDKKWKVLKVKHISPIEWNTGAFKQLVLHETKKELIEAMVTSHISSNLSTDVIEGKGNGLVILLHGGPGTGKTLTAESVAELAKRPLYRVTCGDVGTDPEKVEEYLESVFYIATIWKAVVLLDESDVFLEQRQKTDLERNALVSVFLRALEYYEGILFLTSNRVGTFDEACRSRMQLALHYPPLDTKNRMEIWDNFIALLKKEQESKESTKCTEGELVDIAGLQEKVPVLARHKLNGRQIRNAITTARQLAKFRNKRLSHDHIQKAIEVTEEFEKYVAETQRNHGEFAKDEGLRLEE